MTVVNSKDEAYFFQKLVKHFVEFGVVFGWRFEKKLLCILTLKYKIPVFDKKIPAGVAHAKKMYMYEEIPYRILSRLAAAAACITNIIM